MSDDEVVVWKEAQAPIKNMYMAGFEPARSIGPADLKSAPLTTRAHVRVLFCAWQGSNLCGPCPLNHAGKHMYVLHVHGTYIEHRLGPVCNCGIVQHGWYIGLDKKSTRKKRGVILEMFTNQQQKLIKIEYMKISLVSRLCNELGYHSS